MTLRPSATRLERVEASAFASRFRAVPAEYGVSYEESAARVALFAPTIDALILNRVIEVEPQDSEPQALVTLIQRYRDMGSKTFGVQVSPELMTPEINDALSASSMKARDAWTKFYRADHRAPYIDTSFTIAEIDASRAATFGRIACEGYGLPTTFAPILSAAAGRRGWMHYLAMDGETPTATAAMFIKDGLAWLGLEATIRAYRGRGAQTALIARCIADGIEAGCTGFVAETAQDLADRPSVSSRNMERAGFEVAYQRPNYLPL